MGRALEHFFSLALFPKHLFPVSACDQVHVMDVSKYKPDTCLCVLELLFGRSDAN